MADQDGRKKKDEKKEETPSSAEGGPKDDEDMDFDAREEGELPASVGANRRASTSSTSSQDSVVSITTINEMLSAPKQSLEVNDKTDTEVGTILPRNLDNKCQANNAQGTQIGTSKLLDPTVDLVAPASTVRKFTKKFEGDQSVPLTSDTMMQNGTKLLEEFGKSEPLIYTANSSCDRGLKVPEQYSSGKIPTITVTTTYTDGTLGQSTGLFGSSNTIPPCDRTKLIPPERDQRGYPITAQQVKPLVYKVNCVCDLDHTDIMDKNDHAKEPPVQITMSSEWPKPSTSNEHVWTSLPVEQNSISNEVVQGKVTVVSSTDQGDNVMKTTSDDTLTCLHIKINTGESGAKKPISATARKVAKPSHGTKPTRCPFLKDPKPKKGARPITAFFDKKHVQTVSSADSSITLCPSGSTKSFLSAATGLSYNSHEYLSDSTVTDTILKAKPSVITTTSNIDQRADHMNNSGLDKMDTLDKIELPITHSQSDPTLGLNLTDRQNIANLQALANDTCITDKSSSQSEQNDINDPLPPRSHRARKRKRLRKSSSSVTRISSSSSNDSVALPDIQPPNIRSITMNNTTPCDSLLQPEMDADQAEDYEQVLKKDIVVPQEAADTFRKTRGALVAEAKGQVRSSHLKAMSQADRIPRWALGLEQAPAYVPVNPDLQKEYCDLIREQAKERMQLIADGLAKKAQYFKNLAEAGMKSIRHLYGKDNKKGFKDCKDLLKALATKDKVLTRKAVQKVEVQTGEEPVSDDEIIKNHLAPITQGVKRTEKPLVFRPRDQGKKPPAPPKVNEGAGTSTGGETPSGAAAAGATNQFRGRPKSPVFNKKRGGKRWRSPQGHSRDGSPSDSRSPMPKKLSPGSPNAGKQRGNGKKFQGKKQNFWEGRPRRGQQMTSRRREDQRPREDRWRAREEETLERILRETLEQWRREDRQRRNRQKEE